MSELKYKEGDRVRIKSINWYNKNKDTWGHVPCGEYDFVSNMSVFCGKILTIDVDFGDETYLMKEDNDGFVFTNEMIEGLVEETKPKFKVGDKVRIKSEDWHKQMLSIPNKIVWQNKLTNDFVGIWCGSHIFKESMFEFLGKTMTIQEVGIDFYLMEEDTCGYEFNDEMIEGLVEEESSIDLTIKGEEVKERIEIMIPEGYEYVIESGKIIFTKKKKEYLKTYEECCKVLGFLNVDMCFNTDYRSFDTSMEQWKRLGLMNQFYQLLICRDAYWKIAGDEMGLGKPWKPDWNDEKQDKYGFHNEVKYTIINSAIFVFPTVEMRDAFYENFKKEIEMCKELL